MAKIRFCFRMAAVRRVNPVGRIGALARHLCLSASPTLRKHAKHVLHRHDLWVVSWYALRVFEVLCKWMAK